MNKYTKEQIALIMYEVEYDVLHFIPKQHTSLLSEQLEDSKLSSVLTVFSMFAIDNPSHYSMALAARLHEGLVELDKLERQDK